jgi:hypothetical protein
LASTVVKCTTHETEHGSDQRAIETTFDIATPERTTEPRLLFKNAPWTAIRTRIATALSLIPAGGRVQQQTDRLMTVVLQAVRALAPKARPSSYAKWRWTTGLTQLRRIYTPDTDIDTTHPARNQEQIVVVVIFIALILA